MGQGSKGKTWSVPARQAPQKDINRVKHLLERGVKLKDIPEQAGLTDSQVKNIRTNHTIGAMRLRQAYKAGLK